MAQTFKSSSILQPSQAAAQLRALADGLERGHAQIVQGDARVELAPTGLLHLELDCESGQHGQVLNLSLRWPHAANLAIVTGSCRSEVQPNSAGDSARDLADAIDQAIDQASDTGEPDLDAMTEPYEGDLETLLRPVPNN